MSLVRKSCTIWHTSSQAIDLLKALYFSRFPARKTCIWAQKMQTENSSLGLHMKSSKSEELFKASQRRLHHSPQLPQPNHPWELCSGSQCKTHSVLCCAFSYDCLLCKEFHACKPRPVASVTWKRQFSATTSTTSASWYPSPSSLLWLLCSLSDITTTDYHHCHHHHCHHENVKHHHQHHTIVAKMILIVRLIITQDEHIKSPKPKCKMPALLDPTVVGAGCNSDIIK